MKEIRLPENFLNRMKEMLGPEEYAAYLKSFDHGRICGLRVNTGKLSPEHFKEIGGFSLEQVPWIPNGFYYPEEERPARDPYYYAGLYYIQEPSAMTPARMLPVRPGDRVLDLCAAPGGKSTELGVKLEGKGFLLANDISNSRARALLKNLELWGIANICVTSEEPGRLREAFGESFDKILIDAPCSGEGMFRKDPDMVKSYAGHGPEYYAEIQKSIVEEAVGLLAPGGLLLYSTCTFSVCEDEDIIRYLLKRHEELELVPLELFDGAADGFDLPGALRLFPHRLQGEGHFMALLKKRENGEAGGLKPQGQRELRAAHSRAAGRNGAGGHDNNLPEELLAFLSALRREFDPERIAVKNGLVYYLPEGIDLPKNLRYLRTGLLLGELKKGRFEPSQALAMHLKAEEFSRTVSWKREDGRVIRYLKGETTALTAEEGPVNGWCLVCVDGFPLGFAKGTGMSLKNKYYPGWRWQ